MPEVRVLFEDERLVAIDKPSGFSVHGARPGAPVTLADQLPGLLPVHRLDRGTTGVWLLARDADAHRRLTLAFQNRAVEKVYLALCWGHPRPAAGTIETSIAIDRADRRKMKAGDTGKRAVTRYKTLARPPHSALVALIPETGRTHQLRVHLAYRGHPVLADDLYGGPRHRGVRDAKLRAAYEAVPHLMLHAARLSFPHPSTDDPLIVDAPLPPAFLKILAALSVPVPDYDRVSAAP